VTDLEKRAQNVAQKVANELDDMLQVELGKKGWTDPIHFEAKRGKINAVYNRKDSDNLFKSEYGSEGQAPNAVLRPFVDASEPMIVNAIEEDVLDELFAKGILP
jgi:hypothetical protein